MVPSQSQTGVPCESRGRTERTNELTLYLTARDASHAVYLSVCLPACLPVCPPACLPVYPPVCLSVCPNVRPASMSSSPSFWCCCCVPVPLRPVPSAFMTRRVAGSEPLRAAARRSADLAIARRR